MSITAKAGRSNAYKQGMILFVTLFDGNLFGYGPGDAKYFIAVDELIFGKFTTVPASEDQDVGIVLRKEHAFERRTAVGECQVIGFAGDNAFAIGGVVAEDNNLAVLPLGMLAVAIHGSGKRAAVVYGDEAISLWLVGGFVCTATGGDAGSKFGNIAGGMGSAKIQTLGQSHAAVAAHAGFA